MNTNPPFDDTDGAFAILEFTGDNLEPEHLIPLIHASGARFRRKGDNLHIIFFDGFENGTHFSDLSRDLRQRTAELGITLKQKNPDKFTTVLDPAWTARER